MHTSLRLLTILLLGSSIWACSSSDSPAGDNSDGGGGATSSGGKSGSGGSKSTGGRTAAGGSSSGGAASTCDADAGADPCRTCLAGACCDHFTACLADSRCADALSVHETCFRKVGAEPSACYGDFTRTLQGDAGQAAGVSPLGACIITDCKLVCGGPNNI